MRRSLYQRAGGIMKLAAAVASPAPNPQGAPAVSAGKPMASPMRAQPLQPAAGGVGGRGARGPALGGATPGGPAPGMKPPQSGGILPTKPQVPVPGPNTMPPQPAQMPTGGLNKLRQLLQQHQQTAAGGMPRQPAASGGMGQLGGAKPMGM
jgi:hypothetical protein